ncbi:helix-turn-helix transcriptional regulator [Frankia sp. Cppng1_Ct_nod]|uniref:helix-turn-helix transcriptional regulator n=1 Tax=Frankia sp. Cppng1_Ct_nod TaxID=2897162 RepID=UPI002024D2C2|nr:helix-turn-helix transcriptional regulator [Frankia sp. Cppng1_Ct_nod]
MTPNAQHGSELGRFLRARRGRVAPGDVGLPVGTGLRRTPGLRREELASLAGVSVDYYVRIEQGKETRPSPSVLNSLARVLRLDDTEHEYLRQLVARATGQTPPAREVLSRSVSPTVHLLLESLRPFPAHVIGRTGDVLAHNPAGLRLLAGLERWQAPQRNIARYVFLHPAARDLFPDWGRQAQEMVGFLRAFAGTDPDAPDLAPVAGELLVKSPEFARMWERYDVRGHSRGRKMFQHPDAGELTLSYQVMKLLGTPGQHLITYVAEPATPEHDKIVLLDMLAAQGKAETVTPSSSQAAQDGNQQ